MADKLGDYIVGTAVETIETEKLIGEFEQVIVNDVYENDTSIEAVTERLRKQLDERGSKINTIDVENVYNFNAAASKNASLWQTSDSIASARKKVTKVS